MIKSCRANSRVRTRTFTVPTHSRIPGNDRVGAQARRLRSPLATSGDVAQVLLEVRMGTWNRHRRPVVLLCIGLSLAVASCRRPAAEDRLNTGCVTRLRLPEYPPIAQQARVGLSMTVAVSLNGDGSPQFVTYENVSDSRSDLVRLFRLTIEPAMKASRFEAACGGKTVRFDLSFHLDLDGPPEAVYFLSPNRFEIEAEPLMVNVEK
jgi:hypothetical protein